MRKNGALVVVLLASIVALVSTVSSYSQALFPLNTVVFFPSVDPNHPARLKPPGKHGKTQNLPEEAYLATIESVRPIIDIAMIDSQKRYLQGWAPQNWLQILEMPIRECDDQQTAAWAALSALRWTNGTGLDITFGPSCDYPLASIARILSFYNVPMFTNAGFSEYFDDKTDFRLTRVSPMQNQITRMINEIAILFDWKKPQMLYEKSFWHSELLEGSFCKLLMTGFYMWTLEKKWDFNANPRILPTMERPDEYRDYLTANIGNEYGVKPKKLFLHQSGIAFSLGRGGQSFLVSKVFPTVVVLIQHNEAANVLYLYLWWAHHRWLVVCQFCGLSPLPLIIHNHLDSCSVRDRFFKSCRCGYGMLKILWLCLIITSALSTSNNIVTTNSHPHRLHHRPCGENCTLNSTTAVFHRYEVSARRPAYILFPLPTELDEVKNPFGILVVLVEPVVDVALEDVYKRELLEEGSIKTVFDDSKMSDAHGPNLAIRQLVANKLDCIIGYGFIYSLAIVSRMTPYWADADSHGIPVLTTVGLSTNLDDKTAEYTMMTRMVGPYKFVIAFIYRLFLTYGWRQVKMEFCILSEEKLKLFDKAEYNRLMADLKSEDFETDEKCYAAQLKVEETVDEHIELVRCMVDVRTAEELTADGGLFANDKGGKYTSWNVFIKVQYNTFKLRYPDSVKKAASYTWYQKIASPVWKLVGKEVQARWKAVADDIRKMDKNKVDKTYARFHYNLVNAYCPLCCHTTTSRIQEHFLTVHFPDYKTSDIHHQNIDKLNSDLAVNPKLVDVYNKEFIVFWQSLFVNESKRSQELNEEISLCEQLIREAMNADGNKGSIYNQVQDKTERFACDQNNLTEVLKYVGKKSQLDKLRYFCTQAPIIGRVGQEHIKAINKKIKVYFWTALADVPVSSYATFESCLIMAFFHLDHGKNLAWNVGLSSIPADQKFKSNIEHLRDADDTIIWRNIDSKLLVKIGLVLWHIILQKFQEAVADRSLFASKELLKHYNNLDIKGKSDYTKKCGEERKTSGLSRHATKRKRPDIEESVEALETETQALTQLNRIDQFVQGQILAIQSGEQLSQQQVLDLLSTISGLTQLPQ